MKKLRVVFDVDDVLNNLNPYLAEQIGAPLPNRFSINEATNLTQIQKQKYIEGYSNPEVFKSISFVPGATDIYKLEDTGKAEVYIHSNNSSQEIANIKRDRLIESIPGVTTEKTNLIIREHLDKEPDHEADIIVEDCLQNLYKYDENTVKILLDKPHNQFDSYGVDPLKTSIIRVKDLSDALKLISSILSFYK